MKQEVIIGQDARNKLFNGVEKIAKPVIASLGVNGRNVIFMKHGEVMSTKDGVTIAKEIKELKDPVENLGAQLIKQASIKTADKVGDGTTTSTLLAYEMIKKAFQQITPTSNVVQVKKEMEQAVKDVTEFLKYNLSKDITSEEQLKQIASISANNDEEIGSLIHASLDKAGIDGIIHLEESKTGETYLENVEGMQFDKGYLSPYFVTNNSNMSSVLENPYILIFDGVISQAKTLLGLLEHVSSQGRSLLIIADKVEGEGLATLIVNKMRGTLKVAAVSAPDFGDRRKLILEDIAVTTGGKVVSKDKGMTMDKLSLEWLGEANLVTVDKTSTTIVDGKGKTEDIEKRALELQEQINKSTSPYETEKLNERLSKFSGGVHIIHVGGNTETEMKEKKDRIDDAIHAAKAAYAEGIVPGGGIALLRAKENISNVDTVGGKIIYEVCSTPFNYILSNAGLDQQKISKIQTTFELNHNNKWEGYNIKEDNVGNMESFGIIDPTKVTRNAIQNAVSVAGTLLLTEGIIVDEKEENKSNEGIDPSLLLFSSFSSTIIPSVNNKVPATDTAF